MDPAHPNRVEQPRPHPILPQLLGEVLNFVLNLFTTDMNGHSLRYFLWSTLILGALVIAGCKEEIGCTGLMSISSIQQNQIKI